MRALRGGLPGHRRMFCFTTAHVLAAKRRQRLTPPTTDSCAPPAASGKPLPARPACTVHSPAGAGPASMTGQRRSSQPRHLHKVGRRGRKPYWFWLFVRWAGGRFRAADGKGIFAWPKIPFIPKGHPASMACGYPQGPSTGTARLNSRFVPNRSNKQALFPRQRHPSACLKENGRRLGGGRGER